MQKFIIQIIFMKVKQESTSIANTLKQGLLKKVIAQITKRQFLFKNMNLYSVGQLSNVMQEVNEQHVMTVTSTSIPEAADLNAHPADNMMSMSDIKLMQEATQISENDLSQCKSRTHEETKKKNQINSKQDKLVVIDLMEENSSIHEKMIDISWSEKNQREEQSREVEAFRAMKRRQQQERIKMMAAEKKKKVQNPINLNNQRVMFSYDSKITKLDRSKEMQHQSVSYLTSNLVQIDDGKTLSNRKAKLLSQKAPIIVSNKINLTQKQQDQQRERQRRPRRNLKMSASLQTDSPLSIIKVNPQSHKQHESAILVKDPGVKISIQQKEFCHPKKQSLSNRMNRMMTRSEYLQIKSNQKIRQVVRNMNFTSIDKMKLKAEEKEKGEQSKQDNQQQKSKTAKQYRKKRLYLSPFQAHSKSEKSKILTYSLQGKAELVRQVKEKPFMFQTVEHASTEKKQLSFIDKYNLLYIKFKGNPPVQSSEQLLSELQSQSRVLKAKPSLLSVYSKKSTIKRDNRLIKRLS